MAAEMGFAPVPRDALDGDGAELLVEVSKHTAQAPKPLLRRSARFVAGIMVAIAVTAAAITWKARCAFLATSASEQDMVSLAEVSAVDSADWATTGEDQDALIKWLAASSAAGQAAADVPVGERLAADASLAIRDAMSTSDPAKARSIARRAMKRAVTKTQQSRRQLKAFVKSQRRGLRRKGGERSPSEKAGTANCVFNVLQATTSIAFIASNINDATKTCWGFRMKQIVNDTNSHAKVCAINVAFAIAEVANLAASLSLAADNCAATLVPNVDTLCSGAISGLVYATAQMAGAGTLVAASCNDKWLGKPLPPGVVPSNTGSNKLYGVGEGRRLDAQHRNASLEGPDAAPTRRLMFGGGKGSTATQCYVDASGAMWALAQAGIAINSAANPKAGKSCPPQNLAGGKKIKGPLYKVSEGFCTSDIGGILVGFSQAVAMLQLLVVNCQDKLDVKAICGAGVSGLVAAMSAVVQAGSGAWLSCDEFQDPLLKKVLNSASKMDTASGGMVTDLIGGLSQSGNFGRRLGEGDRGEDLDDDLKDLQRRFGTPHEAFKSMGFDLDDPQAEWRSAGAQAPALEDVTRLVEERSETTGLLGGAATCSSK